MERLKEDIQRDIIDTQSKLIETHKSFLVLYENRCNIADKLIEKQGELITLLQNG